MGGLLFLLPLILIGLLLGHAIHLAGAVTQPVANLLTLDRTIGPFGEKVLSAVGLAAVALVAGLVARTAFGRRLTRRVEHSLLGGLPQYQMMKSMADGLTRVEQGDGVTPALVNVEEAWQIGYLIEPLDNGWHTVFLPQAPTPLAGNILYLPAERVRLLDMTMTQAMLLMKHMGVGSAAALAGADLTLPGAVGSGGARGIAFLGNYILDDGNG
ncbi:hypothetical protein [Reyranella sp.]|uniref:hypothetical protein n=1 Tax=Reyranella sp. TaxID=1929291 RepID=UPI003BA88308